MGTPAPDLRKLVTPLNGDARIRIETASRRPLRNPIMCLIRRLYNCIINAIALARPAEKHIYKHLDMSELERALGFAAKTCSRALVVTDGIFSMRGDHAPLDRIMALARRTMAASRRMSSWWSTTRTASARSARPGAAPRNTPMRSRRSTSGHARQGVRRQRRLRGRRMPPSSGICARPRHSTSIPTRSRRRKRPPRLRRSMSLDGPAGIALLAHLRATASGSGPGCPASVSRRCRASIRSCR